MKAICYITFSVPQESGARVFKLLQRIGCTEGWHEPEPLFPNSRPGFAHTFEIGDRLFGKLRQLLISEGISWFERFENRYTDVELLQFPLVCLSVNRKELDAGGAQHGTTYDLSNACPRCGTGAVQTSPLMLPLTALRKTGQLCEADMGEVLCAKELTDALKRAEVTGLELRQVCLHGNGEALPWWQMISHFDMPKMSAATRGIITSEVDDVTEDGMVIRAMPPCPECKRDGRFDTVKEPREIAYSRRTVDAETLPDVVQTWERFGKSVIKEDSRFSRFAPPLLLVKPKVFDIFRHLKVKHARFEPVRLAD
jgi:hypothetical protein